jgi:phosphoribosylformylglycinamidine synthase
MGKMEKVLHFYRKAEPDRLKEFVADFEYCFNIEILEDLDEREMEVLKWLLSETFEPENFSDKPFLKGNVIEVGPRMNFETSYSTNAVNIFHACGIKKVRRVERSRRYLLKNNDPEIIKLLYDRMTECIYPEPLKSFKIYLKPKEVRVIPLMEKGKVALEELNRELGLGMDRWDIDYYYDLFVNYFKRNPTDVECFQLAQANSEHSRHWFFKGILIIDGKKIKTSLLEIIKKPLFSNPSNSLIAFKDNSSAIRGGPVKTIIPASPGSPSPFIEVEKIYHPVFTAETHNFPTGVAPFPGAETGTGGRIRDVQAVGRGGIVIAGTTGYCVGNLFIPDYKLPWEDRRFKYPGNLAPPLEIEIQASNGASDYGNKFGEPVIQGFTRSFGLKLPDGERREWIKPIMFTGGVGEIDDSHIHKVEPQKGMLIVMIGGPAYRIGIGGGSASSMIAGAQSEELDFNAVQRGDAEMEQKVQRVIKACIEMGEKNPILSIHDQGAGGPCNVLTELVHPAGGRINLRKIRLGDPTLSPLEIWGAEYQERNAILIYRERIEEFIDICRREKCPYEILGEVTGDGKIVVYDELSGRNIVDMELEKILGKMPKKTFEFKRKREKFLPLRLPENITLRKCLDRVLRLLSVGSKRFLTTKVDRSVTGLIARQQCCGPLQLTVSDVAVVAQGYFSKSGIAISIGEAPLKMLIDPVRGAEMAVGEALTNLVWAKITRLEDVKCSANWMWAAKFEGEGPKIYDAAKGLAALMIKLGIAVDGGKDSISMASRVGDKIVKAPGSLVISAYAPCPDITKVITPDLKAPGNSLLFFLDLACGKMRLGGSALAHAFKQIGNDPPGVESPDVLKKGFNAIQTLIDEGISAGHDRSDGGLITTLLEMAFSGNCGFEVDLSRICKRGKEIQLLFNEELGVVVEVPYEKVDKAEEIIKSYGLSKWFHLLGKTTKEKMIKVENRGKILLSEDMRVLRDIWEETSSRIDELQAEREVVVEERKNNFDRKGLHFHLTFFPEETPEIIMKREKKPKVAIIREEGTNGDREMAAAFYMAGFEVWDVMMTDIIEGRIDLSDFRGIVFPGGFSYGDVLDAGKGWAGEIIFNEKVRKVFKEFYERKDTFSFGVCNGCQLMALLGWVPWTGIPGEKSPRFIKNRSRRFESRFVSVKILKSPSIMLKGMEGSVLGVWVAHGEGRFYCPEEKLLEEIIKMDLAPIRFVDDDGRITEDYPFNPNGSPYGITALCSPDGRHLAMMPHPERSFLMWQFPYIPEEWKVLKASPWLKIFQNARKWCDEVAIY